MYAMKVTYEYLKNDILHRECIDGDNLYKYIMRETDCEPEVLNGDGLYLYIESDNEDYNYYCNEYGYDPEDQEPLEIYPEYISQYIISKSAADNLQRFTDETVVYFSETDTYFWLIDTSCFDISPITLKRPVSVDSISQIFHNLPTENRVYELKANIRLLEEYANKHKDEFLYSDPTEPIKAEIKALTDETVKKISEELTKENKSLNNLVKYAGQLTNEEYKNAQERIKNRIKSLESSLTIIESIAITGC